MPSTQSIEEKNTIPRSLCWGIAVVFIAGLLVPAILRFFYLDGAEPGLWERLNYRVQDRHSTENSDSASLLDYIEAYEEVLDAEPLHEASRDFSLRWQRKLLQEGNRKVWIGKDGKLFYRPGIASIIGSGPFGTVNSKHLSQSAKVRRTGKLASQPAQDVIVHFENELANSGIELLLVPVPDKASFLNPDFPVFHPQRAQFYEHLQSRFQKGKILDLAPSFSSLAPESLFLRQDTHWTPPTMEMVARKIAEQLRSIRIPGRFVKNEVERSHVGDLVGMLGGKAENEIPPELVTLNQVRLATSGELIKASDPNSSIVLMGDSFVNIFEDWTLGFGQDGEDRIGSGLAAHLGAECNQALDVIAVNGDGATAARRIFLSMGPEYLSSKRQLVWVLAERDLFLTGAEARAAGVRWLQVPFPSTSPSSKKISNTAEEGSLVFEGILSEKSTINDPNETPYHSALYTARFQEINWISGQHPDSEMIVYLWAFRDRKLLPEANLQAGEKYRVKIVPLATRTDLRTLNQMDDFLPLEQWFVEEIEF